MLDFRPLEFSDREKLLPILRAERDRGCEYTFANLYLYREIYQPEVAYTDDGGAVVRYRKNGCYLPPLGVQDPVATAEALIAQNGGETCFVNLLAEDAEQFKAAFGERVVRCELHNNAEYVYRAEDLADLPGKRFHSKRNHCSRFEANNPEYVFEEITPENLPRVAAMNERWYEQARELGRDLAEDHLCTSGALAQFFELGLRGGLLHTADGVVAWSAGEPVNGSTFCTHIEKALRDVDGAYAVINRDFARRFCEEFEFINREDDAGDEGLRKAKLSYNPVLVLEKYLVSVR